MTSSFHSSTRDELNGGQVANESFSKPESQSSVTATMEPTEKHSKRPRYFSFRKKNMSSRLDPRKAEKSLRRLSFKSVAVTVQKLLIRVSSLKSTERAVSPSGLRTENEASSSGDSIQQGLVQSNVASPKPNWNSVFSGIRNHGNTCFLNAIIQCLSHTDLLAKYFVLDSYKEDLQRHKNQMKKSVGHGEVTERLAVLIKSLWTSRYSAEISSGFKSVVGKHGEQYRGTLQHDAQEFLLWLLDAVHEDINRTGRRKNKVNKVRQWFKEVTALITGVVKDRYP